MTKTIIYTLLLVLFACNKNDEPNAAQPLKGTTKYFILPVATDKLYGNGEQHYVVRNNEIRLNKLLLFIGGSYSVPKNYNYFCDHSATLGLDVISLSYPNDVATAPLGADPDKFIFDNYREELCFGTPVSNVVAVDVLNSIYTRTVKLLQYLQQTNPNENWGQYLTPQNTLQWSKIIVAGHSQGSGHACYLGKKYAVDRVLMFSGANDYHAFYKTAANWLKQTGQTPLEKHFSLLHIQDEIVPFSNQVENLRGLGLLAAGQNPILADNLVSPFSNSRTLSLNIPAFSFHSATVGGNAILPNIWTYMLVR
jgi:hypothetical protein